VYKKTHEVNSDREVLFAIAKTMLQMVVVMHEKNIVHFDLKLEHFILTARAGEKEGTKYEITLIDFGECAVYDSSDKIKGTSRARGTEIHHAPEMLLIDEMWNPGTSSFEKEGNCGNTTAAACLVDGKKCDCYSLGVALCELFFGNSPNRHAHEQNGFLGLLNIVAGGDGDGEEYSRMLRDDIVPSTASSCEARLGSPSDGDIANWLLQTLLVRDPHSRASARRALTTYSDMIK
jgi:serine/threonine protein kinase